jgi:hypothetical protein
MRELEDLIRFLHDQAASFVKLYKVTQTNRVPSLKRALLIDAERIACRSVALKEMLSDSELALGEAELSEGELAALEQFQMSVSQLREKMVGNVPPLPEQHGQLFEITQHMSTSTGHYEQFLTSRGSSTSSSTG